MFEKKIILTASEIEKMIQKQVSQEIKIQIDSRFKDTDAEKLAKEAIGEYMKKDLREEIKNLLTEAAEDMRWHYQENDYNQNPVVQWVTKVTSNEAFLDSLILRINSKQVAK